jgi:hypothetical protein
MLIAQYPMLELSEQIFPSKLANYSGLRIGTEHCLNEIRENELSSDAEPILSFDSKPSPDNPRIPLTHLWHLPAGSSNPLLNEMNMLHHFLTHQIPSEISKYVDMKSVHFKKCIPIYEVCS